MDTLFKEIQAGRYQQGRRQIEALHTLIVEHAGIPGRKTVVWFSTGLAVPAPIKDSFESTIGLANRNHVSFYVIDVRGLQAFEPITESVSAGGVETRAASTTMTEVTSNYSREINDAPRTRALHLQQTQTSLATLAENTGGFLVANTNDFRMPLRRVTEQARSHYELTYTPANTSYDGRFRRIEVKVLHSGWKAQTRSSGYYALPLLAGETWQPYEMTLLNVLQAWPAPVELSYRAGVARLGNRFGGAQCVFQLEVPAGSLVAASGPDGKTTRRRLAWMALVKDSSGLVVRKLSREIAIEENPAEEQSAQPTIHQTETLNLEPGNSTVESAVLDREAIRAGVKRTALAIPGGDPFSVSDIVFVRQVRKPGNADNGERQLDPLAFPGGRVVPTLTSTVTRRAGAKLGLFCVIHTAPEPAVATTARLEVYRDGKLISTVEASLTGSLDARSLPYLAAIPVGSLSPGSYEVVVTAVQGAWRASRGDTFEVVE